MQLNDDDPRLVEAMVDYFYLADYEVPLKANSLAFHIDIFEMGVYFMIPDLRREAKEKLDCEIHMK